GLVAEVPALHHDPVEARALEALEPPGGERLVGGDRREPYPVAGPGKGLGEEPPALGERAVHEVLVAEGEQVEGDEGDRGPLGEHPDPGGGRVDALLQRVEVEGAAAAQHDLAV